MTHSNSRKLLYLLLAAFVIREVPIEQNKEGTSYTRKIMMASRSPFNFNGLWKVKQLFPTDRLFRKSIPKTSREHGEHTAWS